MVTLDSRGSGDRAASSGRSGDTPALQWSIPYQTTPGRNMHYLVRDEAGPNRPIIGIAALGNAILGLAQRDDALGLVRAVARTAPGLCVSLGAEEDRSSPPRIRPREAERIYVDDFDSRGLSPSEDAVARTWTRTSMPPTRPAEAHSTRRATSALRSIAHPRGTRPR